MDLSGKHAHAFCTHAGVYSINLALPYASRVPDVHDALWDSQEYVPKGMAASGRSASAGRVRTLSATYGGPGASPSRGRPSSAYTGLAATLAAGQRPASATTQNPTLWQPRAGAQCMLP